MGKVKKIASLVLSLIMCLSILSSCSGSTNSSVEPSSSSVAPSDSSGTPQNTSATSAKPGDNVCAEHINVIIDNLKIAVINPLSPSSTGSSTNWVMGMVYESLLKDIGEGKYGPNLATSWDTTDYKTITMKLRDDVTFHNGEKFTAADVVYTVKASQAAAGTKARDVWSSVESVTAVDPYTVKFVLTDVNVDFLYDISSISAPILNEKAITADPEKGPWVGTGAYTITDFVTNDFVTVTRNDNYWGEKGITKTVTFKFIPEESTRLIMLQNGEVDVCFGTNIRDLPLLEEDSENFTVYKFVANGITMMGFNLNDPICGDLNFRKAVASALNKQDIVSVARGDYGTPATEGTFWGPATEFKDNEIPALPENLDEAKKYLAASSYKGETIEISAGMSTTIKCAEVIQQQLSLIGINTTIKQLDMGSLSAYVKEGKHQIYCNYCSFTAAAYSCKSIFYPGSSYNGANYNNPDVTKLLDQVQSMTDQAQRQEAYYTIQEQVAKDVPFVGLLYFVQAVAAVKGVDGMVLSPENYHDLRYMYKIVG
jgi:peptide/nickel transport system substrate-binding protein